ncbi:biotin carboxylase N-terminal domain-containing protein [Leifsonia sp. A12D58]|uniref:ATP-binding protein n=1 Tax=Leifsonia sp. A12D58 TaxID=3397674 RepID=UPI0039E13215
MPERIQTDPTSRPFHTVLVANRGEIACRIIGTLRELGIRSVAVFSDADRGAKHVRLADVAIRLAPGRHGPDDTYVDGYLNGAEVVAAARESGAEAIHPGYGFLSENAEFAQMVTAAGLVFVGPGAPALTLMGDKISAKNHVARSQVPVVPGINESGLSDAELIDAATTIGFPLLVKPSAGGGGKGMYAVNSLAELPDALASARRVAARAFGDDTLFLERLIAQPRHIEVQILADNHGNVIHLGERECSLQRRHQKVIEESPSPLITGLAHGAELRARMGEAACAAARSVDYSGAGTIEFLVSDAAPDEFYFMEMNTRLQVEHPATELVTGIDLVAWQLWIAAGDQLTLRQDDIRFTGHAIEARVYAEDAAHGFLPSTGSVLALREPAAAGIRRDSALIPGLEVGGQYDPLLAKVIAWGADRATALARLDAALADTLVLGVLTNIDYLRVLLADTDVQAGRLDTGLIERIGDAHPLPETLNSERMLAAVALFLHWDAWQAATNEWQRPSGWRLGQPRAVSYVLTSDAGQIEVRVSGTPEQATVVVGDGETVTASIRRLNDSMFEPAPPGECTRFSVDYSGQVHTVDLVEDGARRTSDGSRTIWIGEAGASTAVRLASAAERIASRRSGGVQEPGATDPQLRSPMPGTVTNVSVIDGDSVDSGAAILTIEAMKMEHTLVAALAGIVQIALSVGDVVARGQVLATITPAVAEPIPHVAASQNAHELPSGTAEPMQSGEHHEPV